MIKKLFILPAAFFAFACSGNDKKVDDALNADLATAAMANPYSPLDSISAAERAGIAAAATAPALTSTATAPRRSRPVAPRSRSTSYPVYSAPAPQRSVWSSTPSVTPRSAPPQVQCLAQRPARTRSRARSSAEQPAPSSVV